MTVKGARVENDGYIPVGFLLTPTDNTTKCRTNLDPCCNNITTMTEPVGDWYFPNGTTVSQKSEVGDALPYFARNRGESVVRLLIESDVLAAMSSPPQGGHFCCRVPNNSDIIQTFCINICMSFAKYHTVMHNC